MTAGPGKYDDIATLVREKTDASCVVVIVIDGNHGDGFSVQTTDMRTMFATVPTVLRAAATQIDGDAEGFVNANPVKAQVEGYAAGLRGADPRTCAYEKLTTEWKEWQTFHGYGTSVAEATPGKETKQ